MKSIEEKYEILETLREGGLGTLYKARHRESDQLRFVKRMSPRLALDQHTREEFLATCESARRIEHPNMLRLHDFVAQPNGLAYLDIEFVEGTVTNQFLDDHGPPSIGYAAEVIRQTLAAIRALHEAALMGRDFSPGNLLLSTDGDGRLLVKVIDVTRAGRTGLGADGAFMGKPLYAAPEQFDETKPAEEDTRSDLYSLGVTAYELLTGETPIRGKSASQIIWAHLSKPPVSFDETDPSAQVPPALRQIVLRALAKDPADRFANADDFAEQLAPFADAAAAAERPADSAAPLGDLDQTQIAPELGRTRIVPIAPELGPTRIESTAPEADDPLGQTRIVPAPPEADDPLGRTRIVPAPPEADDPLERTRIVPAPPEDNDPLGQTRIVPTAPEADDPLRRTRIVPAPPEADDPLRQTRIVPTPPKADDPLK